MSAFEQRRRHFILSPSDYILDPLPQSLHLRGGRDLWHHPIQPPESADKETEAQSREVNFPRSHSSVAKQDLELSHPQCWDLVGGGGGGVEWAGFCEGIEEWVIWALTISLVSRC